MGIFEKALVEGNDILEYIPQRPPIVMVDKFWGIDGNLSVSGLTVKSDNIFCENGALQECGVIEHIAQSAALRMGYFYKSQNKDVPIGFIGSISKFKMFNFPKEGEEIITTVTIEQELFNITLISAITEKKDNLTNENVKVAECQMKIFLQE